MIGNLPQGWNGSSIWDLAPITVATSSNVVVNGISGVRNEGIARPNQNMQQGNTQSSPAPAVEYVFIRNGMRYLFAFIAYPDKIAITDFDRMVTETMVFLDGPPAAEQAVEVAGRLYEDHGKDATESSTFPCDDKDLHGPLNAAGCPFTDRLMQRVTALDDPKVWKGAPFDPISREDRHTGSNGMVTVLEAIDGNNVYVSVQLTYWEDVVSVVDENGTYLIDDIISHAGGSTGEIYSAQYAVAA